MSTKCMSKNTSPISISKINSYNLYSKYRHFDITETEQPIDSKFIKISNNEKLSESSNFPNFPAGTTPPDDSYMRLIYLNYLANKSIVNSVEKLD